jgi:uncharacterized protein with GYD domain
MAKKSGVNVKDLCWTLGQYDALAIIEASDNANATAAALTLSKLGNANSTAARLFGSRDEDHYRQDGLAGRR